MNTRTLVYSVLVADLFIFGIAFFIPAPPNTLTDLDPNTIGGFLIVGVIAIIFYLIGIVGLFLFKHWGRSCYLISLILGIIAIIQISDSFPSTAFDILDLITTFLILCAIFGVASKEFK